MSFHFNYSLRKRPIVEMRLKHEDVEFSLSAIIDTGADYTVFSREIGERLGLNIEAGEMKILDGAGGSMIAYIHPITMILCDRISEY
jgi:predicted aspartyl protease